MNRTLSFLRRHDVLGETRSRAYALFSNVFSAVAVVGAATLLVGLYGGMNHTFGDIEARRAEAAPLVARMVEANAFASRGPEIIAVRDSEHDIRAGAFLTAVIDGTHYSCGFAPGTGVVNSCGPLAAD
jgi:hypothetical protein